VWSVPVQAITAILYVGTGLICTVLFLHSLHGAAFLISLVVTRGWRAVSETLRADYRGGRKLSAYQVMSVLAVIYALVVFWNFSETLALSRPPDVLRGLQSLWQPSMVLFLQALWISIFLHTGRSMVTGSTLSFHVNKDWI
jgi:hypothetical protein